MVKDFIHIELFGKCLMVRFPKGYKLTILTELKIENLQLVTNKQNTQRRNDTKGYYFIKKINIPRPYHSRKKFNDKQYNIGLFGTPCGAYMANRMFFVNR